MKQLIARGRARNRNKAKEWENVFYTLGLSRSLLALLKAIWPVLAAAASYAIGLGTIMMVVALAVAIALKASLQRDALTRRVVDLELELLSQDHADLPRPSISSHHPQNHPPAA